MCWTAKNPLPTYRPQNAVKSWAQKIKKIVTRSYHQNLQIKIHFNHHAISWWPNKNYIKWNKCLVGYSNLTINLFMISSFFLLPNLDFVCILIPFIIASITYILIHSLILIFFSNPAVNLVLYLILFLYSGLHFLFNSLLPYFSDYSLMYLFFYVYQLFSIFLWCIHYQFDFWFTDFVFINLAFISCMPA